MAENTKIEWADHTFNAWIGCQKVGPGCDHCYAETLATTRLGAEWGPGAPRRRTAASTWNQPRRWNNRAAKLGVRYRVFCSSLADVFDNAVDPAWRADLAVLIRETPHLDWLLLTKRIGNAPDMLGAMFDYTIPANVRVGATIVNQGEWNRDAPKIAQVAVLIGRERIFLSMEPLLGAVDLTHPRYRWAGIVGWVIVGGESGPGARPMHPDWARGLRDQCLAAGVPFMFKQWGDWVEIDGPKTKGGPVSRLLRGPNVAYVMTDGEVINRDHKLWSFKSAWGDYMMARVGKGTAGRHLDAVTHDGVPA